MLEAFPNGRIVGSMEYTQEPPMQEFEDKNPAVDLGALGFQTISHW